MRKAMIAAGIAVVLVVAALGAVLVMRHRPRPAAAAAVSTASSRHSDPPGAASAVRLLVSAGGRAALTPEMNATLRPGRLFPVGTTFTARSGTWHQAGAYANVSGTLRVPGQPAASAEIGLVHRGRGWLVTFEEQG
jgi:hypothetical protein